MLNEQPEGKAYPTWPMGMPRSSVCRSAESCCASRFCMRFDISADTGKDNDG